MKLFVVAALIAVSSAARLEHLQRGYLPPNRPGQVANDFGASSQFGGQQIGQQGGQLGSQGGPAVAAGRNGGLTNQYLPPGQQGFPGNNLGNAGQAGQDNSAYGQQPNQFGAAANAGAQTLGGARPGSQYQPQPNSVNNQYLAPSPSNNGDNFQNIPQQEFDEQSGYKY